MSNSTTPAELSVTAVDASFGAYVSGIDLRNLDAVAFAELYRVWLHYALLVFPGQHLNKAEQIAFARRFGALEFELAQLSNVRDDGSFVRRGAKRRHDENSEGQHGLALRQYLYASAG